MTTRRSPFVERFLAKVCPVPTATGCLLWTAGTDIWGYGRIKRGGTTFAAHRIALELSGVDIPAGRSVLHSCDVRLCVNPAHLRLGTNTENMADMVSRGRSLRGDLNHKAKLRDCDVLDIRARAHRGDTLSEIARDYGVSRPNVSLIVTRGSWAHLPSAASGRGACAP